MGRPRKNPIVTRDPQPTNRDPVVEERPCQQRKNRRYIPASMPTLCPECGHNTRMDDGRHVDPVRCTILEYRTCSGCGAKLAAGRPMTDCEKRHLCSRVEAVKEYESEINA